jgi:hypothetical protein
MEQHNILLCHSKYVNVIDRPKPLSSVAQLSIFKYPSSYGIYIYFQVLLL